MQFCIAKNPKIRILLYYKLIMPTGRNWMNFFYINLGFFLQIFVMFYWVKAKEIKDDWNTYRCNPMYMPMSDDMSSDFTYCVQNIQTDMMDDLLQPLTYATSMLGDLGTSMGDDINGAREMTSKIRDFASKIVQQIFGVFLNIIVEFQRMSISIKDLVGKFIGVIVSVMYIMEGTHKTMVSIQKGPPGQMLNALGGHCFSPDTMLTLKGGHRVHIKNINLNSVLENGSVVVATMRISNTRNEAYYKFGPDDGLVDPIYVTGEHYVQYKDKFIQVKYHPRAEFIYNKIDEVFNCLITDNHLIKIGGYTFWDWEDKLLPQTRTNW